MGVLLELLSFVFFICFIIGMVKPQLIVFWSKKKSRGMACLYLIPILVLGCIYGAITPDPSTSITHAKPHKSSTSKVVKVKIKKAPAKFNFSTAPLTADNVKKAISDTQASADVTGVKISGGTVTVFVYDKNAVSDKLYLEENQPRSAEIFQILFKNKNVQTAVYHSDIAVMDSYGGNSKTTGQVNTMYRKDAEKVKNWDNFSFEPMSQFYSIVNFDLPPESKVSGLHKAWSEIYS